MKVVDARDAVLGRLASDVARFLLEGEEVKVVNAEKAIITGGKTATIKRFKKRIKLSPKGNPEKGPKFPKRPDAIVKRSVRGMLPFKRNKGKKAFKKLRVFIGVPDELKEVKAVPLERSLQKESREFIYLEELSKVLGAKW